MEKMEKIILYDGKFIKIIANELDEKEHGENLGIYRKERDN